MDDNGIPELYDKLYLKLKQAIYYEPDLALQGAFAEYEQNESHYRKEIETVLSNISEGNQTGSIIKEWQDNITYQIQPKNIEQEKNESSSNANENRHKIVFSNIMTSSEYRWGDVNYLFNIPIPLLFLDVWWTTDVGVYLDKELGDCCYANRIHPQVFNENDKSSHLFKKYIDQYNNWRSKAILSAKSALDKKENVTIISLDFTKYFYSINVNFSIIKNIIDENLSNILSYNNKLQVMGTLTDIIESTHEVCTKMIADNMAKTHPSILLKASGNQNEQKKILPIGLFSSKVLSNWYLNEFDKMILENLRPIYYGRYVDDTLFVFSQPNHSSRDVQQKLNDENFSDMMEKYFVKLDMLKEGNDNTYYVTVPGIPENRITVKNSKVKIFQLDSMHSEALVRLFEKIILDNTKVFTYLSEVPLEKTSDNELYHLIFEEKGTNRLRNVERLSINPAALSILIAKQSLHLRICGHPLPLSDKFINSLLSDLKGMNYLEYLRSWEKIFTLFVLSNESERLVEVYTDIQKTIKKLTAPEEKKALTSRVCDDLSTYLNISLAKALSLLSKEHRLDFISNIPVSSDTERKQKESIGKIADNFRRSDMFLHHHIAYPLLNYLKDYGDDLCCVDVYSSNFHPNLELDNERIKRSPRFIHSHEYQLYYALKFLKENGELTCQKSITDSGGKYQGYITEALSAHLRQYSWLKNICPIEQFSLPQRGNDEKNVVSSTKICVYDKGKKEKHLRVGLANMYLKDEDLNNNCEALKDQNLSLDRWLNLSKILNTAVSEKCHLIVLPECAIPAQWIYPLTLWSKEHQIGVIFGTEHVFSPVFNDVHSKKVFAYNLTSALLPFQVDELYKSCCVSLRIKNHYAPSEVKMLNTNKYHIPHVAPARYHLYSWKGSQFTIYNCFELADIVHRGIFRSHLDYLVACSLNKDITYFTDILESVTRDIHCYVVHSNTAEYGCSRIIQPKKHEKRNVVQVGGGRNCTLLVGELDIGALARFQSKNDDPDETEFKPLPPGFDSQLVIERHKLEKENGDKDPQATLGDF